MKTERFRFNWLNTGFTQVLDHHMGHASDPMITDDFGNGIEMTWPMMRQMCVTLADVDI